MFWRNPYPRGSVAWRHYRELQQDQWPWTVMKVLAGVIGLVLIFLVVGAPPGLGGSAKREGGTVRLSASGGSAAADFFNGR